MQKNDENINIIIRENTDTNVVDLCDINKDGKISCATFSLDTSNSEICYNDLNFFYHNQVILVFLTIMIILIYLKILLIGEM